MLDGEVTQRVIENWYTAFPRLREFILLAADYCQCRSESLITLLLDRKPIRAGRHRFLLAITLEAPLLKKGCACSE